MTRILRIVMSGFKSFATKTEIVLGTRFNCVLGPNGSGKSNVMDALSFVLGKGSAREMRAEKAANLIYNGGKAKEPAKQGEVSIYFDNEDKTFPTEEKEVKITRVVKNSGQSVYKINDKVRTRQQILELLSLGKINPDGYNIILQGDIVRFVEMKPEERRLIIEEVSGISIYEEKKHKAENELGKVDQRINEAEIVLAERKTRLDELKEERDQAMRHKELNEKLVRSKATLLNHQIKAKDNQLKKVMDGIEEFSKKVKEIEAEIAAIQKEIIEKREEEKRINNEIEERGEKEQVQIHRETELLKVDIGTSKNQVESINAEIKKLDERKENIHNEMEEIKAKIEKASKDGEEISKRKKTLSDNLLLVQQKIDQYRKDNQIDNAGNIEQKVEEIDKEIDKQQQEIQSLREKQQELLRNKDRVEYQINTIDEKMMKVREVEKEYKKELDDLKKDKELLKITTVSLSKELEENQSIVAQASNARSKLEKLREELSTLNAKNMAAQQAISGNIAVQKILESKSKFGAVYGTISDLGTVNTKYSLALEVAASSRIKSIVVGTDKDAADCINYLKKNRFGSATFIPLNKIKGQSVSEETKKFINAKGVHGLATDLVKHDPKFKNVFSYVFGNTLVVDDIEVARRIGIGSVRMATLSGDLVEVSGAMHGGYKERTGLGFKENEFMDEIKELDKKEKDQQKLLANLDKKRTDSEEKIADIREKKANLEGEIIKKEKSLHLDSEDLKASMKVKEDFKKELDQMEKESLAIQGKISSTNSELAKLKTEKQKLRDTISDLRNPKKLAELNAFEQKKQELREEIMTIENTLKNSDIQVSAILNPEKEKAAKILKQHEKEEHEFREKLKGLDDTIKKKESELKEKEKKEEAFKKQFKELFSKRNKMNEEVLKLDEKQRVKEKQIKDLEIKSTSISMENVRFKAELSALQDEFKQYEGVELYQGKSQETLKDNVREAEKDLNEIGSVNMKALEVYGEVERQYGELNDKKEKLKQEKDDVLMMMNEIETRKKDLFMQAYDMTNNNFKRIFSELSTKGEAYLEMENPENPLEAGVLIKVRITGKKYLDIRSLSGGEKTMTALAFIFSIQEHQPASFYLLDEVDAALDKRNAEKLAMLIKKYSEKAQYLIISHNDGVISEADTLYGVSMNEHGVSKVVSLKV